MRKVREVLCLKHACGASERLIAQSLGIGRTTVCEYLRRAGGLDRARRRARGADFLQAARRVTRFNNDWTQPVSPQRDQLRPARRAVPAQAARKFRHEVASSVSGRLVARWL
jgi:transposase